MQETFIDLDELIIQCRDKQAKQLIQEAVACYRAGAFRSCIVATWNAVVFDFLRKLRELNLFRDAEATRILEHFEKISSEAKFKELWQFEHDIPNWALTKFELIAPIEKSDIERLFEDRSRCAHPSMTSLEEPFIATAELARYHLRSAVMHMLQRPPVQGRAAKERIFQDIRSELFYTDVEKAVQYLQKGPLARARFSLIKDVVLGLTTDLLTNTRSDDERARQFAALNAVSRIHPQQTIEILNAGLSDIILNKVTDKNLEKVIVYLGSVSVWESLNEQCQLRTKAFIEKFDLLERSNKNYQSFSKQKIDVLVKASRVDFLQELVLSKLRVPLGQLLSIKTLSKDKVFLDKTLTPLLHEALPQANIDDLVSMSKDANKALSIDIQPYLQTSIQTASLKKLVFIILDSDNASINHLVEPCLREKVNKASLKELLETKYRCVDELNSELIELFDCQIGECIKVVSFEELLEESDKWDEIPRELMIPVLKENITVIISRFVDQSSTFAKAGDNARLLVKVVEFISPEHWGVIFDAFYSNDQIYNSYDCIYVFGELLRKSVSLNKAIAPHWLSFRGRIERFDGKEINTLKQLIDVHQPV